MRTKKGRRVRHKQLIYMGHRHADLSNSALHSQMKPFYEDYLLNQITGKPIEFKKFTPGDFSDTANNDHAADANRYALEAMYDFLSKHTADKVERELRAKAVVWDMIDKWLEDKVGTCLVLQFKGVKLELRRSQFFKEAVKKADSEVVRL